MYNPQTPPSRKEKRRPSHRVDSAPFEPAPEKIPSTGGDLNDVYYRLRQSILSGALAPGNIINQVHIARVYGVSRTPVREALRMLQAENLVEAQFQHRARVTKVTSQEVDCVYATWILMQSLGVALTVPRITTPQLETLQDALEMMNNSAPTRGGSRGEWDILHVNFHRLLVQHAGPIVIDSIENCWSRSERARRIHMRPASQSWFESEAEHREIVEAYRQGSAERAARIASRQLARNALAVIGGIDPSYDPLAIRQALRLTLQANTDNMEGKINVPFKSDGGARQKAVGGKKAVA